MNNDIKNVIGFPGYGISFEDTEYLSPRGTGWCSERSEIFDVDGFLSLEQIEVSSSFLAHAPREWNFPDRSPEVPYVGYMINNPHGLKPNYDDFCRTVGICGYMFPLSTFDDIATFILAQLDGRDGLLLTKGESNLFYIQGPGCVSGIGCYFRDSCKEWKLFGFDVNDYKLCGHQVLFPVFKKHYVPEVGFIDKGTTIKEESLLSRLAKTFINRSKLVDNKVYVCTYMFVVPGHTKQINLKQFLEHVQADDGFIELATAFQSDLSNEARFYTALHLLERNISYKKFFSQLPYGPLVPVEDIVFMILREWQRRLEVLAHGYPSTTRFFTRDKAGDPILVEVGSYLGRWYINTFRDIPGCYFPSISSSPVIVPGMVDKSKSVNLRSVISYLNE